MASNPRGTGAALLVFATCSWGSLFHVGKAAMGHVDPFWFTLSRQVIAAIVLLAVLAAMGPLRWHLVRPNLGRLAFYGVAGYAVFSIVVFLGLRRTTPSHGALIMATMPVSTVVARAAVQRRLPPAWTWGVALLALCGVFVVSGTTGSQAGASWQGDLVVFVGSLGWVAYTLGAAALPQLDAREYPAFTLLAALPALLAAVMVAEALGVTHAPARADWAAVAPHIAYTVLVPTVAAVLAFNRGVRELGPANAMLFINIVPVSALLISVARGQRLGAPEVVGSMLVVAAIVIQNRMMSTRVAPAAPA